MIVTRTMCRYLLVLTILACSLSPAFAQLPQARLYSVFPPGVAPGQITELRLNTGADLDEVDRLEFNHPGIFATQKFQAGNDGTQEPVTNAFRVAVDEPVPPGRYEVRAVGRFGMSNPRPLLVDPRPHVSESEPNNDAPHAQQIATGTVVNGLINGRGDVDYVRVAARRGQRLVIDCLTKRIASRLKPVLTLCDADDRPVAFAENRYGTGAFLAYDVPADGDYLVKLHDEIFAGGDEHLYQLQIHTGPHLRFVMPPAGVPGTTGQFTLYGYNLPDSERLDSVADEAPLERLPVEIPVPKHAEALSGTPSIGAGLDTFAYRYSSAAGVSNSVRIGLASASTPVIIEQEPNDDPKRAQQVPLPVEVGGQFARPHDIDVFTFDGQEGQTLWIEVIGQRQGVMFDPYLRVDQVTVDESNKELTTEDDMGRNLAADVFDTATDDPIVRLKIPADGTYRVTLRDRAFEHRGDPSLVYRLIIRRPEPDFRLVAIPSGNVRGQTWPVGLRRGDHFSLDVLAFRRDGFDGPITIRPRHLPFGLSTPGTVIPEDDEQGTLVLTATEDAPAEISTVDLVGSARIDTAFGEKTIQHPVRFGGVVWSRNGNMPAISQLESQFCVAVLPETAPFQVTHEFHSLTLHQGRQLLVPMTLERRSLDEKLTLEIDDLPKSAKIDKQNLTFDKGQSRQTLRLFIQPDSPPGTYVVEGTAEASVPYRRNPQRAARLAAVKVRAASNAQQARALADKAAAQLEEHVASLKPADEKLQQAEVYAKATAAAAKQAAEARQAAEKAAADAEKAAKAKDIDVTQPIPQLLIIVKPAPIALEAKPEKLEVKPGEAVDVTITVKRKNSFAGPVTLSLPLPEGASGISAEELTVAAEANSAVLKLTADPEAAEGEIPNLVVRGVMDAGGEAIVDVPISLKVTK